MEWTLDRWLQTNGIWKFYRTSVHRSRSPSHCSSNIFIRISLGMMECAWYGILLVRPSMCVLKPESATWECTWRHSLPHCIVLLQVQFVLCRPWLIRSWFFCLPKLARVASKRMPSPLPDFRTLALPIRTGSEPLFIANELHTCVLSYQIFPRNMDMVLTSTSLESRHIVVLYAARSCQTDPDNGFSSTNTCWKYNHQWQVTFWEDSMCIFCSVV